MDAFYEVCRLLEDTIPMSQFPVLLRLASAAKPHPVRHIVKDPETKTVGDVRVEIERCHGLPAATLFVPEALKHDGSGNAILRDAMPATTLKGVSLIYVAHYKFFKM